MSNRYVTTVYWFLPRHKIKCQSVQQPILIVLQNNTLHLVPARVCYPSLCSRFYIQTKRWWWSSQNRILICYCIPRCRRRRRCCGPVPMIGARKRIWTRCHRRNTSRLPGQSLSSTRDARRRGKKWSYVALHSHFYILIATRDARRFTRISHVALKMERKSEVGGGGGTSLQKGVKCHKFRHLPPSQHITCCCCQQPSCQPHTQ
jgi:hypothetical protein